MNSSSSEPTRGRYATFIMMEVKLGSYQSSFCSQEFLTKQNSDKRGLGEHAQLENNESGSVAVDLAPLFQQVSRCLKAIQNHHGSTETIQIHDVPWIKSWSALSTVIYGCKSCTIDFSPVVEDIPMVGGRHDTNMADYRVPWRTRREV